MSDFYIGWGKGTEKSKRVTRSFFLSFLIIAIAVLFLFVQLEKPFADSAFAYGMQTEIEGQLIESPAIAIRTQTEVGYEIIPLVGFGKMGPERALTSLLGKGRYRVKLMGTLIQYKGNKLFELTNGSASVLSYEKTGSPEMVGSTGSFMKVMGEIVDPKCFFGVMKPGYGKVHKSCAIRCISGQIPPILAIKENGEFNDYYFLTNLKGEAIKSDLMKYVGLNVNVEGKVYQVDNWKSIQLAGFSLESLDNGITICASK